MKKTIIAFLVTFMVAFIGNAQTEVYYVNLKEGSTISSNPIQTFPQSNTETGEEKEIVVYPEIEFQTITGFGGAFNEIGGIALMSLPKKVRVDIMENLFGKKNAHFSYCRTAIGSSDFGATAYSYAEQPDDYEMEHFSIKREKASVIPYIKLALKANPDLKLFASPWSPPGWMKYSGLMDKGIENPELNRLKDEDKIYSAYAKYFAKYVQAYKKEGININQILIQNETDISTKYPSCHMQPDQMAKFVKNYLRPLFKEQNILTEIWAGTFRTYGALDALVVAATKYAELYDGIGIQYTKARYIGDMKDLIKGKPFMHTEGVCHNGKNTIKQAYGRLGEVGHYLNNGLPNYCYWNMILNETTESGWGWKQNSLININRNDQTITYNPDYAVMSLMSKFIRPGAVRVASFFPEPSISIKKDGKLYLFVKNESDEAKTFVRKENGKVLAKANVPGNCVAVMVYSTKNK